MNTLKLEMNGIISPKSIVNGGLCQTKIVSPFLCCFFQIKSSQASKIGFNDIFQCLIELRTSFLFVVEILILFVQTYF